VLSTHNAVRARERRVNRYYDPATDQFLSVDPKVSETGQPYAYTDDDPVNGTDPNGSIVVETGEKGPLCAFITPYDDACITANTSPQVCNQILSAVGLSEENGICAKPSGFSWESLISDIGKAITNPAVDAILVGLACAAASAGLACVGAVLADFVVQSVLDYKKHCGFAAIGVNALTAAFGAWIGLLGAAGAQIVDGAFGVLVKVQGGLGAAAGAGADACG
jgi:hypothetical protein